MDDLDHCNEIKNELQTTNGQHNLPQQSEFLTLIERLASNKDVDVEKLRGIMDLQERVLDRNAEQAFNADMVKCQSEIKTVLKNRKNDQTNSRYADHTAITQAANPIYTRNGFALTFYEGETKKENHVRVMVDILHRDGHSKTRFKDFPIDDKGIKGTVNKTPIHANQSAFTYGCRNLECMVFNIPTGDDDDANAAGGPVEYITTDQQTEVNDLVKEIYDPKPELFWKFMKVDCAEQIQAKDYKKAIATLSKAKEAKAKRAKS